MEGKAKRHMERARALSSGESGLSSGFGGGNKKRKFSDLTRGATIAKIGIEYRPSLAVAHDLENLHPDDPWMKTMGDTGFMKRIRHQFRNDSFKITRDFELDTPRRLRGWGWGGPHKSHVTFRIRHYNELTTDEQARIRYVLEEAFQLVVRFRDSTEFEFIFSEQIDLE